MSEGFGVEPERATRSKVVIDPAVERPELVFRVFEDKAPIARAAAQVKLFRLARLSLVEILARAAAISDTTPIDVRNPPVAACQHAAVVKGCPVAEVVPFDRGGRPLAVVEDLLSGLTHRVP